MRGNIHDLNKAFESRVRLGVMSMLVVGEWVDYTLLKETLELTDGNLASHITALEQKKYIQIRKRFVGKKPNTAYKITAAGRKAFVAHLDALEAILKGR